MKLQEALQNIFYILFWSPKRRFYLSSYLHEDVKKLLALSDGEKETDKLIRRERDIRKPLDDGGCFSVQNDIALLRFVKAIFSYANRTGGEVDSKFVAEANKIVCGNHALMDFGGYLGQLADSIDATKGEIPERII